MSRAIPPVAVAFAAGLYAARTERTWAEIAMIVSQLRLGTYPAGRLRDAVVDFSMERAEEIARLGPVRDAVTLAGVRGVN